MRPYPVLAAEIEAGRAITREEAEAWVRSIQRFCLGPLVLSEYELAPWQGRLQDENDTFAGIAADMLKDQSLCEKVVPYVGAMWFLPGGPREEDPKAFVLRVLCASIGCGEDMNTQILAGALDGKPRDITCPRCGRSHPCIPPTMKVEG